MKSDKEPTQVNFHLTAPYLQCSIYGKVPFLPVKANILKCFGSLCTSLLCLYLRSPILLTLAPMMDGDPGFAWGEKNKYQKRGSRGNKA